MRCSPATEGSPVFSRRLAAHGPLAVVWPPVRIQVIHRPQGTQQLESLRPIYTAALFDKRGGAALLHARPSLATFAPPDLRLGRLPVGSVGQRGRFPRISYHRCPCAPGRCVNRCACAPLLPPHIPAAAAAAHVVFIIKTGPRGVAPSAYLTNKASGLTATTTTTVAVAAAAGPGTAVAATFAGSVAPAAAAASSLFVVLIGVSTQLRLLRVHTSNLLRANTSSVYRASAIQCRHSSSREMDTKSVLETCACSTPDSEATDGDKCVLENGTGGGSTGGEGAGGSGANAGGGGTGSGGESSGTTVWPPPEQRLVSVVERLRALPRSAFPPVSARAAAVLVGLFEDQSGVVRVLLTQRSAQLKSHRGEVCLPGGKRDEDDVDNPATALREAQEELGLDPARVTVITSLPPVLSKHHLSVTPVLALVPADLVPQPNPHEVAAAFTVPLAVFLGQFTDPRVCQAPVISGSQETPLTTTDSTNGGKATGRRARPLAPAATEGPTVKRPMAQSWVAVGSSREVAASGQAGAGDPGSGAVEGEAGRTVGEDVVFEDTIHSFRDIRWGEHQYRIHSFLYGEYDIWGLTATICIDVARLALGQEPSFQDRCPGGHHYSAFFWDGTSLRLRPCASSTVSSSEQQQHVAGGR